ncbi:integrase arm-type DNA-binding domain-containing protein [Rhodobacteraceae bacterium LMO-12]|nr:integrase arm-type DNA-binding domain-containing protein [Rhodobacteraceae bacterium LMO-JJ12]
MPRRTLKELTAFQVDKLEKLGYHRVGGVSGLCLQVKATGSKSWVLRMTFGGKRRDLGLGSYPSVTLSMARERARMSLDRAWAGYDPVEERRAIREISKPIVESVNAKTFKQCVLEFCQDKIMHQKNAHRARQQFENSLEAYAFPILGELPVDKIELDHILQTLRPIWKEKPDTASRVRSRVERVLNWATVSGHRAGENPARWRGHLDQILAPPSKLRVQGHHPALPVNDMPEFVGSLKKRKVSNSALALEFLILTASRSGEVRNAEWGEIDFDQKVWNVPAGRTKTGKSHRIPLSKQALNVLAATPRLAGADRIWSGTSGKPMSDMTIAAIVKKMNAAEETAGGDGWKGAQSNRVATPHGFRSTFRDWAAEETEWPREMAEIALAHNMGSAVERAYRRTDMLERRRAMMQDWAEFVHGELTSAT